MTGQFLFRRLVCSRHNLSYIGSHCTELTLVVDKTVQATRSLLDCRYCANSEDPDET